MPSLKIEHRRVKPGRGAGGWGVRRREALQLLAANMALIAAGCSKPEEEIVPYVTMPERLVPGVPLKFATALPLGGYARGVLVTSHEGRPTKIEGNPRHPASLGSTDIFAEADIFNLYDPVARANSRARNGNPRLGGFLRGMAGCGRRASAGQGRGAGASDRAHRVANFAAPD